MISKKVWRTNIQKDFEEWTLNDSNWKGFQTQKKKSWIVTFFFLKSLNLVFFSIFSELFCHLWKKGSHRKFSRVPSKRKVSQKPDESQKFRESQLVSKSEILYFPLVRKCNFIPTHRMTIIWCALDISDLGQGFK